MKNARIALIMCCAAIIVLALSLSGCRKEEQTALPGDLIKSFKPGKTPEETIESFIRLKAALAEANPRSRMNTEVRNRFFSEEAERNIERLAEKEKEIIVKTDMESASEAKVYTKRQRFTISSGTGQAVSKSGEYEEFLYTLSKRDGLWKIDNAAMRTRSSYEYEGYTPRWSPAMDDWR